MNQLKQIYDRLSWPQRICILIAVAAVVGGLTWVNHWNDERDFKPLFTGLADEDAGALVAKLHEGGVEYRLANGGSTILVPSDKVAEARLQMASAGLPKSGRIGFELFDKANFGASEFTEQVNYHRAIEGELERSVVSIREVETARVHLTLAKDSLYSEARQPAKASVLVKLRHAAALSPQNIAAICQLTASAVPGLSADQVSLVDTAGNLLNRPRANAVEGAEGSEAALDYRKSIEQGIQNKIASTLEPLLGPDHFRIGVSADVDLTSGEQSEEVFDPSKSVMTTSQRTEDGPALTTSSGVPGVASNLPHPASKPSTGVSNYARHTENISYQTSRIVKHTRLPQGAVKKLSLSILVDHSLRWDGARRIVEPPSAEKLRVIHDLVAAATGLDPVRGDQLVVNAFPFESTLTAEPSTPAPGTTTVVANPLPQWLQKLMAQKNFAIIAGAGAGAILVLAVGFFLLVAKMRGKKRVASEAAALAIETAKSPERVSVADAQRNLEERMAGQVGEQARKDAEAMLQLKLPEVTTKKTEVIKKHIAAEAKKDPTAMAQVVRTWLNGEYQR
ncbi:MAG TPA: flagellar basal-body MS-ring/collar protein FliF [Bryobacteraceae bacterium]|jgi:flagellar M-ring protein FliF|nr:flagellar basal-body MS-ring/collar protein FliF [Bryobacteraceae bacterium]